MNRCIFTLLVFFGLQLNAQNAYIQFLHNSADVTISTISVTINGSSVSSLAFRTGTPYIAVDTNGNSYIKIEVLNEDDSIILSKDNLFIEAEKNYLCVLQGVTTPDSFRANPNGRDVALDLLWIENILKDTLANDADFEYLFIHGVTDAPLLDIRKDTSLIIVDDLAYGESSNYISIEENSVNLHVLSSDGSITLYTYKTNFPDTKIPVVYFLSGFVVPSANENGEFFEMFALLPDGSVVTLSNITRAKEKLLEKKNIILFPNPTTDYLRIKMDNSNSSENIQYTIYNINGRLVTQPNLIYDSQINLSSLAPGYYLIELSVGNNRQSLPFIKH